MARAKCAKLAFLFHAQFAVEMGLEKCDVRIRLQADSQIWESK
jgi:hypothetical protein